jgi:hypothetical protein
LTAPLVTSSNAPLLTETMVGLSNAERQRRYVARLKEKASTSDEALAKKLAAIEEQLAASEAAGAKLRAQLRQLEIQNRKLREQVFALESAPSAPKQRKRQTRR